MRRQTTAILLGFALTLASAQVFGELVLLKSGKSIDGIITYEDDKFVSVRMQSGELQIERATIERILDDSDVATWKQQQESIQAEPTPEQGTVLRVIEEDRQVFQEQTLEEIGMQSRRAAIEALVDFEGREGNAAKYYAEVLDRDRFKMGAILSLSEPGKIAWNHSHPIFSRFLHAARLKDCRFYPEFLPYPVGVTPQPAQFRRLLRLARGLIAMGEARAESKRLDEAKKCFEAALILGYHVGLDAPVENQFGFSIQIQVEASLALAEYYLVLEDREKYLLYAENARAKEKERQVLELNKQAKLHDFRGGKIGELMEYARNGNNLLLRRYVLNLLVMLKLAGEQLPLRRDIRDTIPLEYSHTFTSLTPADSQEIVRLFRAIQQQDASDFMRNHAGDLLTTSPLQLASVVNKMLGKG